MARLLLDRGFTQVSPLEGGLDGWLAAGNLVEDETLVAIRKRW